MEHGAEMNAPQIIIIILFGAQLGIGLAYDGKQHQRKISFMSEIFRVGVNAGLLYWGGFFG